MKPNQTNLQRPGEEARPGLKSEVLPGSTVLDGGITGKRYVDTKSHRDKIRTRIRSMRHLRGKQKSIGNGTDAYLCGMNEFELHTEPVKLDASYNQYPGMGDEWIEANRCTIKHNHTENCLKDSPFVLDHQNGYMAAAREDTLATYARTTILACRLLDAMDISGQNVEIMRRCMLDHPYTHLLAESVPTDYGAIMRALRAQAISALYRRPEPEHKMEAQAPDDIGTSFFNIVANKYVHVKEWTLETVRSTMKHLTSFFGTLTSMIHSTVQTLIEKLIGYVSSLIFEGMIQHIQQKVNLNITKISVYSVCAALAVTLCGAIGLIASDAMRKIIYSLVNRKPVASNECMIAEGGTAVSTTADAVLIVTTFVTALFSLNTIDQAKMKNYCTTFTSVVAAGTAMTTLGAALMYLMPVAIQRSVFLTCAPEHLQKQAEIAEWNDKTIALLRVRKCPNVLTSTEYYRAVNDQLANAPSVFAKLKDDRGPVRMSVMSNHAQLVNLSSTLYQFKNTQASRPKPFGIHMFGPPGTGKTICTSNLIRQAFDKDPESDSWCLQTGDEYWSGYINQKVIVMDEHLTRLDGEARKERASMYLALMSTAPFVPPMPSVDNPITGIKGTMAAPDVVITINNTAYDHVQQIKDNEAMLRRRELLIELRCDPNAHIKKESSAYQVDLHAYAGEIDKMPWIQFRFLPVVSENGKIGVPDARADEWMSWDEMIAYVRKTYHDHRETCKILANATQLAEQLTPEELINNALAETFGLPQQPQSLMEVVSNFFTSDEMTAEGGVKVDADVPVWTKKHTRRVNGKTERLTDYTGLHHHRCSECQQVYAHTNGITRHTKALRCNDCDPSDTSSNHSDESNYVDVSGYPPIGVDPEDMPYLEYQIAAGIPTLGQCVRQYAQYLTKGAQTVLCQASSYLYARRRMIACLVAVLSVVRLIYNAVTGSNEQLTFLAFGDSPSSSKAKSQKQQKSTEYETQKASEMQAEGSDSSLMMEIDGRIVRGFGLRDRYIITYSHGFFSSLQEQPEPGAPITIRYRGNCYTIPYDPDCLLLNQFDVARYEIRDTKFPQFANITRNFLTEPELMSQRDYRVIMTNEKGSNAGSVRCLPNRDYSHGTKCYMLPYGFIGNLASDIGDCGSIVRIQRGNKAGSVLGIHVAGSAVKAQENCSLATPITREMLAAFDDADNKSVELKEDDFDIKFVAEVNDQGYEWPELDSPENTNLRSWEMVPRSEQIHLPAKTKLRPTKLQQPLIKMGYELRKQPPALTPQAVYNGVADTLKSDHQLVDEQLLQSIFNKITAQYKQNLVKHPYHRKWTMEEACGGFPSWMSGVDVSTSPGYPLIRFSKQPGKKDFIWYEGDQVRWSPIFEQMVDKMMVDIEKGHISDAVFVGYLKDELRTSAKVADNNTRIIYSGDLIATVAFRRLFGSLLMSFNNSGGRVPSSIGLNQYSHDMNIIYQYLTENGATKFLAGDYKGFDKHFHPQFQKHAYDTLYKILIDGHPDPPTPTMWKAFVEHQTQASAQIGPYRFSTHSNHMSGCFFTTVINCLVNEAYLRYCFIKLNPTKRFEEHIKMVCLGDDHVVAINDDVVFDGPSVQSTMTQIGQEYTAADKSLVLPMYQTWEEITYLGAHPRIVQGLYTGAGNKHMIRQLLLWQSKNGDLEEQIKNSIEHASQWDQEFYEQIKNDIKAAAEDPEDYGFIDVMDYFDDQRIMVARTSNSGESFGIMRAQGADSYNVSGSVFRFGNDTFAKFKIQSFLSCGVYQPFVGVAEYDGQKVKLKLRCIEQPENRLPTGKIDRFAPVQGTWQGTFTHTNDYLYFSLTEDVSHHTRDLPVTGCVEYDGTHMWINMSVKKGHSLVAQGDDGQIAGLTTFRTDNVASNEIVTRDNKAHLSVNEQAMGLSFGTNTKMYRNEYAWTSDQPEGTIIATFDAPHDILAMGDPTNIQNMPFRNFIYVTTDVSITLQLNGTPFQQGLIALYFYPLSADAGLLQTQNVTAAEHVLASPNLNSTVTLTIPFRYYRNVLNTYAADEESLGTFAIQVLSPLASVDSSSVVITMYSSFPNAKFTIPRPVGTSYKQQDNVSDYERGYMKGIERTAMRAECDFLSPEAIAGKLPMIAEGQGASKSTINNTYNISDVAGNIPIQGSNDARGGSQTVSPSTTADVSMIPMDNPPIASGAVPMAQVYSGMSKAIGVEPTVALQLGPEAMYHYQDAMFNPEEMTMEYLLGKKCLLDIANWDTTDVPGADIARYDLSSICTTVPVPNAKLNRPFNLAVLNLATFWRADFELEFHCVRTHFHSGRLQFTIGYGAPALSSNDRNVYYNTVMDFNGETDRSVILVKYNAATEFLRTYEGPGVVDPIQNYSMGHAKLFVANQLRAPDTVATRVKVLVFIRVVNAVMAVPRPIPFVQFKNPEIYQQLGPTPTDMVAQGDDGTASSDTPVVPNEEAAADDNRITTMATATADETPELMLKRCQIHAGAKFEYPIVHVPDLIRRHAFIAPQTIEASVIASGVFKDKRVYAYHVQPYNITNNFYAGWAGTLKFRIFICSEVTGHQLIDSIYFVPFILQPQSINAQLIAPDASVNIVGGYTASLRAVPTGSAAAWKAQEVAYNINRDTGWIDVSVPFQTHFNFAALKQQTDPEIPQNIGSLLITQNNTTQGEARIFVAQAAGDDFKYGFFRPPLSSTFAGVITAGTPPTGDYQLGGYSFSIAPP